LTDWESTIAADGCRSRLNPTRRRFARPADRLAAGQRALRMATGDHRVPGTPTSKINYGAATVQ
jgi:hypothetical protein